MTKKRVLFVDDEPNILSGIKRMMRPLRKEFEVLTAEHGEEALTLMGEQSVDIIVSDMRMPIMDGAELLTKVMELFPRTVRIMLTGQADEESVLKTVNVAHQFLSKPCAPEMLREVLTRSAALLILLDNEHLQKVISGIGSLPSLPSVYAELQDALKDPEVDVERIGEIIEQDIAMTAKLMQLVNSSFFGLYTKVESPQRAVKLLGIDTINALVLGVQVFSQFNVQSSALSIDYLWHHSMAVAKYCKVIAMDVSEDKGFIDNCFLSGLLHDIGRILLLAQMPEEYNALVDEVQNHGGTVLAREVSSLQTSHAAVGGYLMGLWGFSSDIVEAVSFHHSLIAYPASGISTAAVVHMADIIYYRLHAEEVLGEAPELELAAIEQLGCGERFDGWHDLCRKEKEKEE